MAVAGSVTVDLTQLRALAADLRLGYRETAADLRTATQDSAKRIRDDWRRGWSGLAAAPYVAAAVTYDTKLSALAVEAEIGPDKDLPQGPLGNLLEFGSVNNAPIPAGAPALRREEPRFLSEIERIAAGLLG